MLPKLNCQKIAGDRISGSQCLLDLRLVDSVLPSAAVVIPNPEITKLKLISWKVLKTTGLERKIVCGLSHSVFLWCFHSKEGDFY